MLACLPTRVASRSLLMYAEAHPARAKAVAAASVAHLTAEYALLRTDPVIKWAQTRWPTFVEVRVARYPLHVMHYTLYIARYPRYGYARVTTVHVSTS